jgi:hypothetical protein
MIKHYKEADCRAESLFGATDAAAERLALKMDDFNHRVYDPTIAAIRERLGENDFNVLWTEGRRLTLDKRLSLPRNEAKPPSSPPGSSSSTRTMAYLCLLYIR